MIPRHEKRERRWRIGATILFPCLIAIIMGMTTGWYFHARAGTETPLSDRFTISMSDNGAQPKFTNDETDQLNRCVQKWDKVIDQVSIKFSQTDPQSRQLPADDSQLKCFVIVSSPDNRMVVARPLSCDRNELTGGIVSIMDRAGDSLCALPELEDECGSTLHTVYI